jgi:hypothetical protein
MKTPSHPKIVSKTSSQFTDDELHKVGHSTLSWRLSILFRLLNIVLKSKVTKIVVSLAEHWFAMALAMRSESGECISIPFKDAETALLNGILFRFTILFSKVTRKSKEF